MINLLPYEKKAEARAARTNTILVRYILILGSAVLLLTGLVIASYIVLFTAKQQAEAKVERNESQVTEYTKINNDATELRTNLATAKTILDKETNYSALVYAIAASVPRGVVLDSLTLDSKTLGKETELTANARSNQSAIELKESFAKQTDLFGDVKFSSISGGESASNPEYPVKVTLSLIIKQEALK